MTETNAGNEMPKISIILPAPPSEDANVARAGLESIEYDQDLIEIILANGRQPSCQRNAASKHAHGELIYFLDSDSVVSPQLFKKAVAHLQDIRISGAGGPELGPKTDSFLQKCFGHVLGSFLGCFNTKGRFAADGEAREGTERNFILCNFIIRKDIFIESGGFNEDLYPNEENELINRLRNSGCIFMYDPTMYVNKSRRANLKQFIKQIFNYGRGRMEHVLIGPIGSNLIYFIPLAFMFYLLTLPFINNFLWRLPMILYIILAVVSSAIAVVEEKDLRFLIILPFLYLLEHVTYAAGMIWGFVRKVLNLKRSNNYEVTVKKIKEFVTSKA